MEPVSGDVEDLLGDSHVVSSVEGIRDAVVFVDVGEDLLDEVETEVGVVAEFVFE